MLGLLRTMGRRRIEVWCYNWMPLVSWSRTSTALRGRGGATVSGFDAAVWDDAPAPGAPLLRGAAVGDARLVPRAGRAGGREGGREVAIPHGRPAALADSWHGTYPDESSRPPSACSRSSRARPSA